MLHFFAIDPLIFSVTAVTLFLLAAYRGASAWFLYFIIYLCLIRFRVDGILFDAFFIFLVLFLVKPIRRIIITKPLIFILKKIGALPKVSETEEIALRAGNVWIEEELFSGRPNFKRIFNEPYKKLSKAEKSYMDNQVNKLCELIDDWSVFTERDLSKETWNYLKKEKFFGMIIPKKYGGLGFSALGHSAVVQKLATRSQVAAITVMVPNSLGPAELLMKYGTEKQKDYYLPRLADGREIPCFGLTETGAGSDATSIVSGGEVFKDKNGKLAIKLNFRKRYITLGAVATVIGLAFKLKDPKNLLGKGTDLGITCALLNAKSKGISITRHDPLGVPFVNACLVGENVVISADDIIGGAAGAGEGWKMLMECLSIGRGISLPATSTGGAKMVARVVGDYAYSRRQFGVPIAKFEGVSEKMAEIAGFTYMLDAARIFTACAIDNGYKPAVTNALAKYHFTEKFREVINHGMDILGGAAICKGPNNLLAHAYMGTPIAITVEGANIMTRSLIHFGQGAIRCHPYSYHEMKALQEGDDKKFDHYFFKHLGHLFRNKVRTLLLGVTRGRFHIPEHSGLLGRYECKLAWMSARFAFYADLALAYYGGSIKLKEQITGRFGDILSAMYFISCLMQRYKVEGQKPEDEELFRWGVDYWFAEAQKAFIELHRNFAGGLVRKITRGVVMLYDRLNPFGYYPDDKLSNEVAEILITNDKTRDQLTQDVFISTKKKDMLNKLEACFVESLAADKILKKVKKAIKRGDLEKSSTSLYADALKAKIITKSEKTQLDKAAKLQREVAEVNSFELKDYMSHKMKKPL